MGGYWLATFLALEHVVIAGVVDVVGGGVWGGRGGSRAMYACHKALGRAFADDTKAQRVLRFVIHNLEFGIST